MSDEPRKRSRIQIWGMDFPQFLAPGVIHLVIAAFIECAISRIIGKPQFVIQATLPDGQTGWTAARKAGSPISLVSRENAAVYHSRFTAAVALSKMSRPPRQLTGARVEQIR
jgi:hypothetical protein